MDDGFGDANAEDSRNHGRATRSCRTTPTATTPTRASPGATGVRRHRRTATASQQRHDRPHHLVWTAARRLRRSQNVDRELRRAQPLVADNTDCDDFNVDAHPGGVEVCNAEDDDCDSEIILSIDGTTWNADVDGDGYGGKRGKTVVACKVPDIRQRHRRLHDTDANTPRQKNTATGG
jgi:hypothetical protein